ncbi:MAG: hypothetical protein JXA18_00525 [Chitinispirillaceae bacterium]|nr:hypothetical protein [Chitinispirillaceae bacterium]
MLLPCNRKIPAAALLLRAAIAVTAPVAADTTVAPLPSRVDNRTTPYFPTVISQVGESCASANAVGYIFTYEINAARDAPVSDSANRYPYFGTYNFLNDGSEINGTYTMFVDAWTIIRDNGIHNEIDFGSIEPRSTKWVSGYEKYFRAMHNRVASIDSLSFLEPATLAEMKRWLYDHGNGSPSGGIFTITASAYGVQDARIADGPESGKWIIRKFGTSLSSGPHSLAVVCYDDNIRYDYNNDGKVTDTIDINGDGVVTQADCERGAFVLANTWGESSGDGGFIYAPYRLFMTPLDSGGTISNRAYFITVRKEYRPLRTFRVTLTHTQRSAIALSVGIAADSSATVPDRIRSLRQFTYAGGNMPMCGYDESPAIEIGLDVTDLLDSIHHASAAAYFLIIDAKDNNGRCDALSLIDYSGSDPQERHSSQAPLPLAAGRNLIRVTAPPMGIVSGGTTAERLFLPTTRHSGKSFRIRLPAGATGLTLFNAEGKTAFSSIVSCPGEWFILPERVPSGSYFILISDRTGRKMHGRAAVVR